MDSREGRFLQKVLDKFQLVQMFLDNADDNIVYDDFVTRSEFIADVWSDYKKHEDAVRAKQEIDKERVQFEEQYLSLMSKTRYYLRLLHPTVETKPIDKSFDKFLENQNKFLDEFSHMRNRPQEVKLPPINIPQFNGDYYNWPTFENLFLQIHENQKFSNIQKFQYLKGLMVPNSIADEVIKHFPITDNDYLEAWDKLKERFNKKRHIVTSFIRKFVDQPPSSQLSLSALRSICDTTDQVIRGLRTLGPRAESRDPFIIYLILEKLDSETRHLWAIESQEEDFPTTAEFLDFLSKRCDALESVHCPNLASSSTKPKLNHRIKNFAATYTQPNCPKCSQSHFLHDCSEFKSLNITDRQRFVSQKSLCFNCLKSGHGSRVCRGVKSCHKCNKRHHTLIHFQPNYNSGNDNASAHASRASTSNSNINHTQPETQPQSIPHTNVSTQPISSINSFIVVPTPTVDELISSSSSCQPSSNYESSSPINMNPVSLNCLVDTSSSYNSNFTSRDLDYKCNTLIPTANVCVVDSSGSRQFCRALLDSGSHASFITESCAQRLCLHRRHARKHVSGLACSGVGYSRGYVKLQILCNSKIIAIDALILHSITSSLPSEHFDISSWNYLDQLQLADSQFNVPGSIDILIGIEESLNIFSGKYVCGPENYPVARDSVFGWIVCGKLPNQDESQILSHSSNIQITVEEAIDNTLRKFWEIESVPEADVMTPEERECEEYFKLNVKRDDTGRFSVRLPFKSNVNQIGNSLNSAMSRLHSMERRFAKNPHLKCEYSNFISEYLLLSHMSRIPQNEISIDNDRCFYLPHHAVVKEESSTTKLRVVFDGSSKSSSGISINDNLLVGASLQPKLFSILLNFRTYKIPLVADIEKMFRQIRVHDDNDYMRIVWREDSSQEVQHFRLNTVTYGLVCSPFLATRALRELATIIEPLHPKIAKIVREQFYVDDLMAGAESVEEAVELRERLSEVLSRGGFILRKWKSCNAEFLSSIPTELTELTALDIQDPNTSVKVLGMQWVPNIDCFVYKVKPSTNDQPTKRSILSEAASVYDPLGFLSPSTVIMKTIFQKLCLRQFQWDGPVSKDIKTEWLNVRHQLHAFNSLQIPRFVFNSSTMELHCFADASEIAYSASIYLRTIDEFHKIDVNLLAAKTKVAPLRTISIPRLELCGALLLVRLLKIVKESLQMDHLATYCYSDSTTVLSWLSAHPNKWKTFVANRTTEILDTCSRRNWFHVASADNAADCASRGMLPEHLLDFDMWWHGPMFLRAADYQSHLGHSQFIPNDEIVFTEEKPKRNIVCVATNSNDLLQVIVERISKWSKVVRVMAYILNFIDKVKARIGVNYSSRHIINTTIQTSHIKCAELKIIQLVQHECFTSEIQSLRNMKPVSPRSTISALSPFLHEDLLRVGGRLEYSSLPFEIKHQLILPKDHPVSHLIIHHYHLHHFHAGTTLLMSLIRQRFWIVRGRSSVRNCVHKCLKCFRDRATTMTQIMGSLPASRTLENISPFTHTGIDYAGPLNLKDDKGRKARVYKGYIVIFVCFSTKALHIEVVKDLTSEAFISALRKFVSRRGNPAVIYTDNGLTFVGACRVLKQLFHFMSTEAHSQAIIDELTEGRTKWQFIPPNSPHFGGLWEAGVKSVKQHLKKVINTITATHDELSTMLYQIEALLNSRPLCPVSDDPTDFNYLTPGHFLIGKPITMVADPDLQHIPENRLSKFQFLQKRVQGFWKTWRMDYLTSMQQRPKWRDTVPNIKEDDLVLIKEDKLPAGRWNVARVLRCYPGPDNKVRVVDLKSKDGVYQRPIHKLCLLPIN